MSFELTLSLTTILTLSFLVTFLFGRRRKRTTTCHFCSGLHDCQWCNVTLQLPKEDWPTEEEQTWLSRKWSPEEWETDCAEKHRKMKYEYPWPEKTPRK